MPDIFDVDYDLQLENLLSPLNRAQANLDYVQSIGYAAQNAHDLLFKDYKRGATYSQYNILTSYNIHDRVRFNKQIYESLVDVNLGISPINDPASPTNWMLIQDNYIGVDERVNYSGQTITLCYAINKWFDITAAPFAWLDINTSAGSGFDIFFPNAVFLTLGATTQDRENNIRQFVDKYAIGGIVYAIIPY
jgi:hypothetical protein